VKRLWLACFVIAAAWLATLAILTVGAKTEARSSPRWRPAGPLDVLNVGGWLLVVGLPSAIVVVSTAYYLRRRYFAKPS
jgi:hypothetical protein